MLGQTEQALSSTNENHNKRLVVSLMLLVAWGWMDHTSLTRTKDCLFMSWTLPSETNSARFVGVAPETSPTSSPLSFISTVGRSLKTEALLWPRLYLFGFEYCR